MPARLELRGERELLTCMRPAPGRTKTLRKSSKRFWESESGEEPVEWECFMVPLRYS